MAQDLIGKRPKKSSMLMRPSGLKSASGSIHGKGNRGNLLAKRKLRGKR